MSYSFHDLSSLLAPASIAIVGASERHGSAGRIVIENLIHLGYNGAIYPINPKNDSLLGFDCYKSLDAVGKPIEMVAILIGANHIMDILKQMVQLDIRACWCLASGFSESGEEGKRLQKEIADFCYANQILLCGPNCVGVLNMIDQYAAFSVAMNPNLKPGSISAVMQSGAILMGLANSARFGFRYLISAGNQAVLDTADYIGYLATDPLTKVIIAFIEGIPDAEKFIAAVRAAREAKKPVLVLKVGKSEGAQRAVQAHTGSLAGSDAVLDAVFKKEGVIRVNTLDELLETAELFALSAIPANDKVCMISLSGGQIGLAQDLSEGLDLNFGPFSTETVEALQKVLPPYSAISNPLDAWGNGNLEETYPKCVEAIMNDPGIGMIAMSRDTPVGVATREIEQSMKIAESAVRARNLTNKAVCLFSNFSRDFHPDVAQYLRDNHVPYLQGTQESLHAIKALEDYASLLKKEKDVYPQSFISDETRDAWRNRFSKKSEPLTELESRQLLADYGIEGPREKIAHSADEAVNIADEIGYPVVMKVLSADIKHKTESGGVKINIPDAAEVSKTYDAIMKSVKNYNPQAVIDGIIVQKMISQDAVEVIVGIIQDQSFGPVVVFGSGGILVELLKDSALAIPPLSKNDAQNLIRQTKAYTLLKGFRNHPEADQNSLIDALLRISQIALDFQNEIVALEINPVMVLENGKGIRAVDALIELKQSK